jgi:hypothetical protein
VVSQWQQSTNPNVHIANQTLEEGEEEGKHCCSSQLCQPLLYWRSHLIISILVTSHLWLQGTVGHISVAFREEAVFCKKEKGEMDTWQAVSSLSPRRCSGSQAREVGGRGFQKTQPESEGRRGRPRSGPVRRGWRNGMARLVVSTRGHSAWEAQAQQCSW